MDGRRFLYRFLLSNKAAGPYGINVSAAEYEMTPGDIIQLGRADGTFYHSLFIISVSGGEIYVATHSYDSFMRPLSSYIYENIRYIHIQGARRY
jgi:hypothetical protein